jgi:hypothetical protein
MEAPYRTVPRRTLARRSVLALASSSAFTGHAARETKPEGECVVNPCMSGTDDSEASSTPTPLDVAVTIRASTDGGGLTFVVTATNRTDAPMPMLFRTGQYCDVMVTAADGSFIWRWAAGRMFTQALREILLDPGQTREVRLDWPDAPLMLVARDAPWSAWVSWVSDPGGSAGPVTFGPDLLIEVGT